MVLALIIAYFAGMIAVLMFVHGARSRDDDYIREHSPSRPSLDDARGLGLPA